MMVVVAKICIAWNSCFSRAIALARRRILYRRSDSPALAERNVNISFGGVDGCKLVHP
jgi:hypothetical protein